ncbi:MAG: hypothetical protein ABSC42_05520 [Tepidisphaeraceae bacterium]
MSEQFLRAAMAITREMDATGILDLAIPVTMNWAFALELALKAMIGIEENERGNPCRPIIEHRLDRIFGRISPTNQAKILKHADDFIATDQTFAITERQLGRKFQAVELLAESAAAFEIFRYSYEWTPASYTYIAHPIDWGTRKVILEYHPEWPHENWAHAPRTLPTFRVP